MFTNLLETLLVRKTQDSSICFGIRLPNDEVVQNKIGNPTIFFIIPKWLTFARVLCLGTYGVATAYTKGSIEIEGDLRQLGYIINIKKERSQLQEKIAKKRRPGTLLEQVLNFFHKVWTDPGSHKQAEKNATFHYGYDSEFYRLYLGETRSYSTATWYPWTKTLEEAQYNKWGFILKKLQLTSKKHIASLGSGFGYGELMAAREYGAKVDCFNATKSQNKWLREEIKRQKLEHLVTVYDADYRKIENFDNYYDGVLFIESIEHVGSRYRQQMLTSVLKAMKDDAVGVIQWLSFPIASDVELFIRRHLYPGVEMPPLGKLIDEVVLAGGEVQDLVCNRRHYHYTLNVWYENFVQNYVAIQSLDPQRYTPELLRTWKLYLAAGSHYLSHPDATARLFQLTFTKGTTETYPMNRNFLYSDDVDSSAWVRKM